MKIDFSQPLKSLEGAPFMEGPKVVTLGFLASGSLLANYNDENPSGDEKFARFNLAAKIHSGNVVEVSPGEITKIKQMIGKFCGALLLGPAYIALNNPVLDPEGPTQEQPAKRTRKLKAVESEAVVTEESDS